MSETTAPIEIDVAAIEAELANLSQEDLAKELLKIKTQQKFQQKKQQGKGSQKAYMKKQQERRKLIIQLAKEKGIFDTVNEQAEAAASAKFNEFLEAQTEPEGEGSEIQA